MSRCTILITTACLAALAVRAAADEPLTFEKHVRPIFKAHCFQCHGEGDELKGNLDLRLRRLLAKGGDTGAAIVAGQAEESLLVQRIRNGEMPPAGKPRVSEAELAVLARWIAAGANTAASEPEDPAAVGSITAEERNYWAFQPIRRAAVPVVKNADAVRGPVDAFLLAKLESHSLTFSPEAPKHALIRRATFDLLGLPPSPEDVGEFIADAAPDAFERLVDRLLASPHYGERWGRHWLDVAGYADSDGYSETDPVRPYSYKYRDYVIRSLNADKPFDQFIVEQLAGDELVPPPHANLSPDQIEKLVATGFLRTVPDGTASGAGPKEAGNAVIAETIKVVSTSLLGLTVGCAQCHNHRYDPIPQTDYYRLRAIFEPAFDLTAWRSPPQRRVSLYTDADRARAAEIEAEAVKLDGERTKKQNDYIAKTLEKELAKIAEDRREAVRAARAAAADKRTPEQAALLKEFPSVNVDAGSLYLYDNAAAEDLKKESEKIAAVRATKPVEDFVSCLTEVPGQIPETKLFFRGDLDQPKQSLPPGELTVLDAFVATSADAPAILAKDPALPTTGRRLAYARHLTSGRHPLVARVLVNRAWLHHFGRGIVATPGDFGTLGERPTHPELLDWLAREFVGIADCELRNADLKIATFSNPQSEFRNPQSIWSLKTLHRQLMTSAAYRQSSQRSSAAEAVDPDNRLLSRMSVRRLEAEGVRDAILALNGTLNARQFGSAVPVMEDDVGQIVIGIENKNGENRPGPIIAMHGEDFRRSVYVQVRRTRPLGVLDAFDLPTLEPNCTSRSSSTVTPQSLLLMNNEFVLTSAQQLAARIRSEAGPDLAAQATRAWQLVFARSPTDAELQSAVRFLTEQSGPFAELAAKESDAAKKLDPALWACTTFCQALLSSNEFLYVE